MLTIQEAADYIGIDYIDDEMTARNLQAAVNSATYRLYGSVGRDVEEYLSGDPRITDLLRIYAKESYDNRGGGTKQDSAKNYLRDQLEIQLQLELRALKAEAGGEG